MREANLQDSEIVFYGEFNQQSGYEMTRQAMALTPPPTAFLAANNFIAIGAFKALQEMHLRIPEDISLVAFDDLPPSFVMFPFLTVAYQPSYEMGKKATELLLSHLSGEAPAGCQEIELPVEVMIRRSSAGLKPPGST
jgi:LacI family transcriptional regulator